MSAVLLTLSPHPDTPPGPVTRLQAQALREGAVLAVRFVLEGDLDQIAVPQPAAPDRADELWKHTCFEAFVRAPGAMAYREFNLAPSGRWQAYDFTGYRERAADPAVAAAAAVASRQRGRKVFIGAREWVRSTKGRGGRASGDGRPGHRRRNPNHPV